MSTYGYDSDEEAEGLTRYIGNWRSNSGLPDIPHAGEKEPYIQELIHFQKTRPFNAQVRASIMGTLLPYLVSLQEAHAAGSQEMYNAALAATQSAHTTVAVLLMRDHFPTGVTEESIPNSFESTLISYATAKLHPRVMCNAGEFPMESPDEYEQLSKEVNTLCQRTLADVPDESVDISTICQGTRMAENWADHIREHHLTAAILREQLTTISASLSQRASELSSGEAWVERLEEDKDQAKAVLPGNAEDS